MAILFPHGLIVDDLSIKCMENDIVDVEAWARDAVMGKVDSCRSHLIREWQQRFMDDPDVAVVPADLQGFLEMVFAPPDYRNRAQREADEERLLPSRRGNGK